MLQIADVERIVQASAAAALSRTGLKIHAEPISDEYGSDAYQVTVVLPGDGRPLPTGEQNANFIWLAKKSLSDSGDDGFPFVDYVTEDELASEELEADAGA